VTAADVKTRVTAALAELGDTRDAVADRLRALNIKGYRNDENLCPIALYLARIDQGWVVEVLKGGVYIDDGDERGIYLDLVDNHNTAGIKAVG
jgi:hypothetical protein